MKIGDIFSKPIERIINPAVVVSKQDKETINIEIEEYVFTQDLIEKLYRFLNNFILQEQDKTGIWINGYYGSGKSHFIKYVYYCFYPATQKKAFDHFIKNVRDAGDLLSDATVPNILRLKRKIAESKIHSIIFNIDAVSGQKDDKQKITTIFFNQFNAFRGYNPTNIPLAILLEKHLDELGVFDSFKQDIKEKYGKSWEDNASTLASLKLNDILQMARKYDRELDIEALSTKLKDPDDITITDNLIPEFNEYLLKQPDNYKLIFIIDEVSQYIGKNTNLLLNLQTIIEEIGANCNNKIWIACTAQQVLEKLIESTEMQGDDFGKILGRFETRISLESQDAAYITQKRILDKESSAVGELTDFYIKNKDAITNQYVFAYDLYKGYEHRDEFLMAYPFIPYQFRLIADVFESFSNLEYVIKEVKDNERSVLAITHFTVKKFKDKDVGYFIPFDAFFNELFSRNMTHIARRIIERAWSLNEVETDLFAKRVVNTLFMISNISETKKMTFPPNIENLTILLMDQPDSNRLELQNKIQKVLDTLIAKNIISEENNIYQFYKEDEIDVANLIQNTKLTFDDRYTILYEYILRDQLNIQRKVSFGNNAFTISLKVDGKEIFPNGDIPVIISAYENKEVSAKALQANKNDLVICINDWFFKDDSLKREFEQYMKTKKYIKQSYDSATGTRKVTIEKFGSQNTNKLRDLTKKFSLKFIQTPFISSNQLINPNDIKAQEPSKSFNLALQIHLKEIYKKNHLAHSSTNDELKKAAESKQSIISKTLSPGEELINTHLEQFGTSISVDDTIKMFLQPPYGWKDTSTIDMLLNLAKKNKRKFEWRNEAIDLPQFVKYALKTSERSAIMILAVEEVGADLINDVRDAFRQIFNEDLRERNEANALFEEVKNFLKEKEKNYTKYDEDYHGSTPFGIHFHQIIKMLEGLIDLRDPKVLFEEIINDQQNDKKINDQCKDLVDFIKHQYKNYAVIKEFTEQNKHNFTTLINSNRDKAATLVDYFENEDLPGNKFPQIKKIYEELQDVLKDHFQDLQKKAVKSYTEIFKQLDSKAKELQVSDPHGIYNAQEKLNEIKEENNISQLKLTISEADNYQLEILKQIIEDYQNKRAAKGVTVKETEIVNIETTQIETEDQLNSYLEKLRTILSKKIKENKIIIIK